MINKFLWLLAGIVVGILLTTYSAYIGPKNVTFNQKIDSLNHIIDSNKTIVKIQNAKIEKLIKKDSTLVEQVETLTKERNKAKTESNKKATNPNLSNSDTLYNFFVERYPTKDKVTFSLPKESAVSIARDLLYCDGDRQDLIYSDSINNILNKRIVIKDSTIYSYHIKDTAQQTIINTQDTKYNELNKEYTKVSAQNKILKLATKITSGIAVIATILYIVK